LNANERVQPPFVFSMNEKYVQANWITKSLALPAKAVQKHTTYTGATQKPH